MAAAQQTPNPIELQTQKLIDWHYSTTEKTLDPHVFLEIEKTPLWKEISKLCRPESPIFRAVSSMDHDVDTIVAVILHKGLTRTSSSSPLYERASVLMKDVLDVEDQPEFPVVPHIFEYMKEKVRSVITNEISVPVDLQLKMSPPPKNQVCPDSRTLSNSQGPRETRPRPSEDRDLQQENIDMIRRQLCRNCKQRLANQVFIPCGHMFYCNVCYAKSNLASLCCPSGCGKVERSVKVFRG